MSDSEENEVFDANANDGNGENGMDIIATTTATKKDSSYVPLPLDSTVAGGSSVSIAAPGTIGFDSDSTTRSKKKTTPSPRLATLLGEGVLHSVHKLREIAITPLS